VLAAAAPGLALLLAAAPAATAGPGIGVASALEKLRPGDPVPPGAAIDLVAARGECESAQVAVRAERGLRAVGAEATALVRVGERSLGRHVDGIGRRGSPSGDAVPVTLYRVATVRLDRPSGPDGESGEWPDALVPVRDGWFGEPRRAFPVEVPAGRLQAIWVELCVPDAARPGRYAGAVRITEAGAPLAQVPVRLRVWPFALPRTPTFTAAFGLSTRLGTRTLGVPDDPELARALAAAALRHRVTPFTLSADPPDGSCTARACDLDWSRLDAELAPVLDGRLVPGVRGGFAEVRIPGQVWSGPEEDLAATLRAWQRHFASRGWADRLWLYTLDEPKPDQLAELARRARLARAAGIKVFATTVPQPALAGVVDAFAPNVTLVPEAGRPERVSFSYASCLSHGCGELPEAGPVRAAMVQEFTGWPGYEIDRPGAAARALAWLAWRRGLSGELYYDMLESWRRADPWSDVRAFAGNGDGTLLYPGRPEALGGKHPFPVESIRLKLVRDGLEDVELLRLATAAGLGPLAESAAARLVPSGRRWARAAAPWLDARRRLGDTLARRASGPGRASADAAYDARRPDPPRPRPRGAPVRPPRPRRRAAIHDG
jgi:hypothetical protein